MVCHMLFRVLGVVRPYLLLRRLAHDAVDLWVGDDDQSTRRIMRSGNDATPSQRCEVLSLLAGEEVL
jgi:hypothetical protein